MSDTPRTDAIVAKYNDFDELTLLRKLSRELERELAAERKENERLLAFRDYFADKCEGLFFQFGMEVIDLYNATHGSEVCRIEPDRADL